MSNVKRTISGVMIVVLLCYAIALVWQQYRAHVLYVPVQTQINRWADSTDKPTPQQWLQVFAAIDEATRLQPLMAEYQLSKAKVLEWGWYWRFAEPKQLSDLPSLYQKAQQLRPRWAQAYADEAWYWFFIGQNTATSTAKLNEAFQLGPFVPEVLFRGLTIQLQQWPELSVPERAVVLKHIKLLFETDLRRRLVELIRLNQRQKVACLYLRQQQNFADSLRREVNRQFCEVQR